ncbi:ISKra4 family transposase [Pseudactinotalea sp. Z1732]|uniref:ISKra4 family transposase n=1 Tax=Pseudactinotalea sp. Z1732 TaxID=3413026 RepID=UPI003C7B49B0
MQGAGGATGPAKGAQDRPGLRRGKRGLCGQGGSQVDSGGLYALADAVAELAATEARALVHAAAQLTHSGRGGVLEAIERAAQRSAAAIGLAAVAGVVNWAAEQQAGAGTVCKGGSGHTVRLVATRPKTVRTLLGPIEVIRGYYHCRACARGFAPLDERLGITGTSLSPGLSRACALAGAEMAYAKGFDFITTVTGLDLASTSTLGRVTRAQGARARAVIAQVEAAAMAEPSIGPAPAPPQGDMSLCYLVLDGTGAPMLPSETNGRAGKDGVRARTREVKIACLFTQSGLDGATGEPVQDPGSASYISTFEPAATFATHLMGEYRRRGFHQIRQPIIIGDGAKWIWTIAGERFPAATQIVDYFHAREHLADLTKLLTPILGDATVFERDLITHLDLGHTDQIAAAVANLDLPHRAPDLVAPAAIEVGYFTGNHQRMQYTDFKANGYYIGSGPVESACNTIVKQRAKRAGMHWTIQGLDPVLAIRTLQQSHRTHILWPTPAPQT